MKVHLGPWIGECCCVTPRTMLHCCKEKLKKNLTFFKCQGPSIKHLKKAISSWDSKLDSDYMTTRHSTLLINQNMMGRWRKLTVYQKWSPNEMESRDPWHYWKRNLFDSYKLISRRHIPKSLWYNVRANIVINEDFKSDLSLKESRAWSCGSSSEISLQMH